MTTAAPASRQIEVFRELIAERLGLQLDESKEPEIAELLTERIRENGCQTLQDYMERLTSSAASREEWRVLAERLTVGETYFLRNPDQFRAFVEVVLEQHWNACQPSRALRILCAGCASGEEAYTLAILLNQHEKVLTGGKASIRAIDINRKSLHKAREGRYSKWSVRQVPQDWIDRSFAKDNGFLCIDQRVRSLVSFEERNLLDPAPVFWAPGSFDVVFCRNVIMYFSLETARRIVARIAGALTPGGYLFLGHAETLRGISKEFQLLQSHDTFYYQRRAQAGNENVLLASESQVSASGPRGALAESARGGDWFEAIQRASERIASLKRNEREESKAGSGTLEPVLEKRTPEVRAASPQWELGPARIAFEEEHFGKALDLLAQLPREAEMDAGMLILRAMILVNRRELGKAEEVAQALLGVDDLNPGAHYVMALCCEHTGRAGEATGHYRSAIYLDRNFAMAYLQLGKLARREGNAETARRELRQALELLQGEDAARILLFGGGFPRAALVGLCLAELRVLGENV